MCSGCAVCVLHVLEVGCMVHVCDKRDVCVVSVMCMRCVDGV